MILKCKGKIRAEINTYESSVYMDHFSSKDSALYFRSQVQKLFSNGRE